MTQRIRLISGHEPMREGEYPIVFQVGVEGVTEIEKWMENFGDHGVGWYRVKKGDQLFVDMNARAVAEVHYEDEQGE